MNDNEFESLFKNSEPYLNDEGFTEQLMTALPQTKAKKALSPWLKNLPALAMFVATALVFLITPMAEIFTQVFQNPLQWQSWFVPAVMALVLICVSLVWVNEERVA